MSPSFLFVFIISPRFTLSSYLSVNFNFNLFLIAHSVSLVTSIFVRFGTFILGPLLNVTTISSSFILTLSPAVILCLVP